MSLQEVFAKAIEDGDSIQIESLLTSGSIDINARLPRQNNPPPLVLAVQCGARHVDIVAMLLNAGAHIDQVDDNNQTASFAAAWANSVDLLAVLLRHRPNLEIKRTWFNQTPLQLALQYSSDSIAISLIAAGGSLDGLDAALCRLASRSTAAIQALIDRGVALNQLRGDKNQTPLHMSGLSCVFGWSAELNAAVNMLINVCRVDVDARDVAGETCTHAAALTGGREALRCFIDAGADVNVVNRDGLTPLHAVFDYTCALLLLAAGADVNKRKHNRTPLQVAVSFDRFVVLPAFLAAGADLSDVTDPTVAAAVTVSSEQVESARRDIAKTRLDFVRQRAMEVCVGLHPLQLDALQMCEILLHTCGPVARVVAFHEWWKIATTVKHFHHS